MKRVSVGFIIGRTYKSAPSPGKTLYAESQRIYPTREAAEIALEEKRWKRHLDIRYDHEITEAFMTTYEE